jgi:hypothetical protein
MRVAHIAGRAAKIVRDQWLRRAAGEACVLVRGLRASSSQSDSLARIFHRLLCEIARRRLVAQTCSLLYRRLLVGRVCSNPSRPAGWKPAIQQIGNLRYTLRPTSACEICRLGPILHTMCGCSKGALINIPLQRGVGQRVETENRFNGFVPSAATEQKSWRNGRNPNGVVPWVEAHGLQPLGVGAPSDSLPRVARASQPWALGRSFLWASPLLRLDPCSSVVQMNSPGQIAALKLNRCPPLSKS